MNDATLNLISARELSARLKTPVSTIWRWQRDKVIPSIRLGHRTLLFDPAEVRKALESYAVKAKRPEAK